MHKAVNTSLTGQLPAWGIVNDAICVINGNQFRPDIGGWNPPPTRPQRLFPLIYQCPPPNLWIEVIQNLCVLNSSNGYVLQVAWNDQDRDAALTKITYLLQHCQNTEFVLIVLLRSLAVFPPNPTPGIPSVAVGAPFLARPRNAPYVGRWPPGALIGGAQWHIMQWNHHLVLVTGALLEFNPILEIFT